MAQRNILVLIPARLAATRLPGKPLADLHGMPMIVHVLRRAEAAAVGEVAVATDSEAVAAAVEKAGGRAVMTRADHVSGSDRRHRHHRGGDPRSRGAPRSQRGEGGGHAGFAESAARALFHPRDRAVG